MPSVAIAGAGLAGLVAAYELSRQGLDVQVFETSGRVGGVMHSTRKNGYLIEYGPNTIQNRGGALDQLIADLGLENDVVEATPAAKKRYIVRENTLVPVPASPPSFLTSRLFSFSAKMRLLREPFLQNEPASEEESVAEFVRRRLGEEILDYAVNPFIAGIYAGDPEELSIQHTFPTLYELESEHGSLIKGQLSRMRAKRDKPAPKSRRRMFSFRDGLKALPKALAAQLPGKIHLSHTVTSLSQEGNRWIVTYTHKGQVAEHTADALLWTAPLHCLSHVDIQTWIDLSPLREVVYAPVSVVALGFRAEAVTHPLDGFGVLVPERERECQILGTLFSSTLFPDRAPEGHILLTTFIGGQRHPHFIRLSDESLIRTAYDDLKHLLKIRAEPTFTNIVRWTHAIPQYRKGYGTVKQTIERLEHEHPGLYLAGNFRSGVSVSDTVATASSVSRRIADSFSKA